MVYIVILAYNEEKGLPLLLQGIREHIEPLKEKYLVLVIDDGSRDRTPEIAKREAQRMPLRVISHETNRGVGAAFRTGITEACCLAKGEDIIFTLEGDNTNDPAVIPQMVKKMKGGNNLIIASRFIKGGSQPGFPLLRRIYSRVLNLILKVLFPIKGVRDYSIFYRAYRAKLLKDCLGCYEEHFIQSPGFVSNAEILLKVRRFGIKAVEVPLCYRYGLKESKSRIKIKRTIWQYLLLLLKARRFKRL